MTDGPGPHPLTKIPGSAHVLIQILSYCCFIYAGMPYNNYYLGLFWKSLALMTSCILYQLKVLSVKLECDVSEFRFKKLFIYLEFDNISRYMEFKDRFNVLKLLRYYTGGKPRN